MAPCRQRLPLKAKKADMLLYMASMTAMLREWRSQGWQAEHDRSHAVVVLQAESFLRLRLLLV